MGSLTITNGRILTLAGQRDVRRGPALLDLAVIERGYIVLEDDRIAHVGEGDPPGEAARATDGVIDAAGCVVMPAFVDCHTHACWAGNRFDEFEQRLAGASYLSILKQGGGIMSTVRAVRAASEDDLVRSLRQRLARMATLGTGTVEIKSGYGLETASELKMLRAIERLRTEGPMTIQPTFLGAHAIDPENPNFIEQTITQTLREVMTAFPAICCDAYCEEGAWPLDDVRRLFEEAQQYGCPLRVHADQFNSLGATQLAVQMNARSVDHLEASTPDDLMHLARSATIGVVLPCTAFHLDTPYAPARAFIDAAGAIALATNYNPGSAPTPSMPFAIALACRKLGMTVAEAITAATYNAACVLELQDEVGSLEAGKRADVQILDTTDERELAYEFASAGPRAVILGGRLVSGRSDTAVGSIEPTADRLI